MRKILHRLMLFLKYGYKANSQSYISKLKRLGMHIGERTTVFEPYTVFIDPTRPYLVDIGDDVQITRGVTILTHGYDWAVLKGAYGEVLGSSGRIIIGNNVFIGMNTTILKGIHIGNNVIIGANSFVSKDIPDNCVAAGNPVRVIMTLEQYYKKRKAAQMREATELVQRYRKAYGKDPGEEAMSEFFFCSRMGKMNWQNAG